MGYLQEVDRWLDDILTQVSEERIGVPELKRAIREKILESYRNGCSIASVLQKAEGQSPASRAPSRSEQKHAGKPHPFTGDWQCSKCGGAITSLPFQPRGKSVERLQCLDCYNASREAGG